MLALELVQKEIAAEFEQLLAAGAVILDSETTGMSETDEIIELAVINGDAEVLVHSFYKPLISVSAGALSVHGYTDEFLANKQSIVHDYERLKEVLAGRTVLIYNSSFDDSLLRQTFVKHGLEPIQYRSVCVMHKMMDYFDSERFISLANASGQETKHDALSDCQQVLAMMRNVIRKHKM